MTSDVLSPMIAGLKETVAAQIEAEADRAIALSRDLHAHPETLWEEHRSVGRIAEYIEGHSGITLEKGTAGLPTAFRAWTGRAGAAVGIICEYDAVPGLGHACGHNLIAAGTAAALVGLAAVAEDLPGRVVLIGSPAEEGGGGKIALVERGVYDGLDAVLQVHPADRHRLSGPTIGVVALSVEFRGLAAHVGSAPDRGINAVDALVQFFTALNGMRQRMRDGARLYGIITRGGDALNTVPDLAAAQVGVRAQTDAYLDELVARVDACARAAAMATGCAVTIDRVPGSHYPPMRLNRTLGRLLGETVRSLGEDVEDFPPGFEGYANDAAAVSHVAPVALLNYRIGRPGLAEHSQEFMEAAVSDEGHRGMLLSARVIATAAIDLLADPMLRRRVREEFERSDRS